MISYTVCNVYESDEGIVCELVSSDSGEKLSLLLRISDYYDARLSAGDVVTDEEFERLYEKSETARALIRAERMLSYGVCSKKQLVLKLRRVGIDEKYANNAADILEERGYIDENEQAKRAALAYCRQKHWGRRRIVADLLSKGYEKEAVMLAVNDVPREEYTKALSTVIERKYPAPPDDRKERDRRIAALLRLGFSMSEITEAFLENYN